MASILVRQGKNYRCVGECIDGKFNRAFDRLIDINRKCQSECVSITEDCFQKTFPGFRPNEPLTISYARAFQSHSDTLTKTVTFITTIGEL